MCTLDSMKFWAPPQRGILLQRYKRFFADVELDDGEKVTAHCVNTGAMMGLTKPGSVVWVCPKKNTSKGRLDFVWMMEEMQEADEHVLVGVNTTIPSLVVKEALTSRIFPQWNSVQVIRGEPKLGSSRLDFILTDLEGDPIWIEVKNVHLKVGNTALFPDCVTQRGTKHLYLLSDLAQQGKNASMVYVVQREDCTKFQVAGYLDHEYGKAFEHAQASGVRMFAYGCSLSLVGITLNPALLTVEGVRWQQ